MMFIIGYKVELKKGLYTYDDDGTCTIFNICI